MLILGINSAYHESSACLLVDGELVAAAEEERFNRSKHGKPARVDNPHELPTAAIRFCLDVGGERLGRRLSLRDVDHAATSFDPEARLRRNLEHTSSYPIPEGDFGSDAGERTFHRLVSRTEGELRRRGFRGTFTALPHHDCHAASAFLVSPFEEAAVLVVDGIGEFESTTLYHGQGSRLRRLHSLVYPNSLGLLWEKICIFSGFSEYDACKLMGLASYGRPEPFRAAFARVLRVEDGGFEVDDETARLRSRDCSALADLFGMPPLTERVREITEATQPYADLAAALQEATEEALLALARDARERTGSTNLCMAGGVALNCVANGRLLAEGPFEEVFIQPAAHDAGTALGAALLLWTRDLGGERSNVFRSPYLGPRFSDEEIEAALAERGLVYRRSDHVEADTAELLTRGNVISWFQGAMELGPRALGNRSILADPRDPETVERINLRVKHREPFRPFCPSVLAEEADDWFEIEGPAGPASYMLAAYPVRPGREERIPAVCHIDGTCRIQRVEAEVNPRYHRLIREFRDRTGVPVLLNTSFNDSEPIVCTPRDAVRTFLGTRIDYLVAGPFVVAKADNRVPEEIPELPLTEYFERLR